MNLSVIPVDKTLVGRRITADYVADAIRQTINNGLLPDGTLLNQVELAAHFGVSRVPVREALRQLQAEGLVEARAHRLTFVRGMDLDQLVEVFSLRALVEGWLIQQAVGRIKPEEIERARAVNEQLREKRDHARWLELNTEFHGILYGASGARLALETLEPLRSRSERYVRLWLHGTGVHRPAETYTEHCDILKLLVDGDAQAVRAAVETHVLHTRERVVEAGRRQAEAEKQA